MFLPAIDVPIGGAPAEPVAVIYPPHSMDWHNALERTVVGLINRRLPPSRILFVCPRGQEKHLVAAFDAQEKDLKQRLRSTTYVVVAAYDDRGHVADDEVVHLWPKHDTPWPLTDTGVTELGTRYIEELSKQTKAILHAPPGHQFRKLSGSSSRVFVRAGNMLREMDSINVYSHMLLRHWSADAKIIYVDSFTVLSFAMALQRTIAFFSDDAAAIPSIENFHSYEKASDFDFPPGGQYLVIISASTSGALADELVKRHRAEQDKIVHLIGAGTNPVDQRFRQSCICFHELGVRSRPVLNDIRIDGEEFIPSYGEPTTVNLTTRHIRAEDARRYKDRFYQKYLKLQRSASAAGYESYSLFSVQNEEGEVGPGDLDEWVAAQLIHDIPASVSLIVHLADPASKILSKLIFDKLTNMTSVEIISLDDVAEYKGEFSTGESILIVANEDPNLEGFVRAGTMLRRWSHAFRHFVLGHAFPETRADFDRVKQSLRMRAGGLPGYGWSDFAVAAVGRLDIHVDSLFSYPVQFGSALMPPMIVDDIGLSKALTEYSEDSSEHVFLPKLDGTWLVLRQGSVFFEAEYQELSDEVVYLAVATAVQSVREGTATNDPRLRFDSNPFVGSVIDPQMFSRFSDGILQGALLRCLHPAELDFSGSTVLSRRARELFVAVIRNATNVVGEAVLEFLAALAAGKVSLNTEDYKLVEQSVEDAGLSQVWELFKTGPAI